MKRLPVVILFPLAIVLIMIAGAFAWKAYEVYKQDKAPTTQSYPSYETDMKTKPNTGFDSNAAPSSTPGVDSSGTDLKAQLKGDSDDVGTKELQELQESANDLY